MEYGSQAKNYRAVFDMCRKYDCRHLAEVVFALWNEEDVGASSRALLTLAYEYNDNELAREALYKSIEEKPGYLGRSAVRIALFEEEYLARLPSIFIGKVARHLDDIDDSRYYAHWADSFCL
jgi:hypothetical protein